MWENILIKLLALILLVIVWLTAPASLANATSGQAIDFDAGEPRAAQAQPASSSPLSFGVVPQQAASQLAQAWAPLLRQISQDSGLALRFRTTPDIPSFESCLAKGVFDIAYMNPYHYSVFHETAGYVAFARARNEELEGLLVVKRDSPIQSLEQLAGSRIAFPAPAALGASVLPRAELGKLGVAFEPAYVNSHDSVYLNVLAGLFPAGGGIQRTYDNLSDGQKQGLRIIYRTKRYKAHPFAAHSRLPPAVTALLGRAMLTLNTADNATLKPLGFDGFVAAADADYDDIRDLKLMQVETGVSQSEQSLCPFD